MNRNIITRLWPHILCGYLFTCAHCYGKDSFYAHDPAEEQSLIEFVRNHPDIDFSTYLTNGVPILRYVTLCNYTNFLVFVEDTRGAISSYNPIGPEPTLLEFAMNSKFQGVIDYLASVRPDWVFEPHGGFTAISSAMLEDNVLQVEKFLNMGVDVHSNRWNKDLVWIDTARDGSVALYELLRSRGARFGWDRPFRTILRQELWEKYSGEVVHLYTNKLGLPDNSSVDFVIDPDGHTVSSATLNEIKKAIATVGARCNGTVLMMFHTPNAEPVNFRLEEIVDRVNVAIVRIPSGMESSPGDWPMEYLPYLPTDQ